MIWQFRLQRLLFFRKLTKLLYFSYLPKPDPLFPPTPRDVFPLVMPRDFLNLFLFSSFGQWYQVSCVRTLVGDGMHSANILIAVIRRVVLQIWW
jgi:hypothetical protein